MFRNREDAAHRLAHRLKDRPFQNPIVLAIPPGGLVIGAILARALDADLDVVLSRKIRSPGQPDLAVGAVDEDGKLHFNHFANEVFGLTDDFLARERRFRLAEMAKYRDLFRAVRAPADLSGRSVIATDDSIATGSTMMAAVGTIKVHNPSELIVAVPVASVESTGELSAICRACDEFICLHTPRLFWSIDQFYADFGQVSDEQAVGILRSFAKSPEALNL